MLSFILLFNALLIFSEKIPGLAESFLEKKAFKSRLSEKEAGAEFSLKVDKKISWEEVLEKKGRIALINMLGFLVLSVFSLGLFLDIRILTARVKKREIFKTRGEHLRVKWGIGDIFKLAIIFVFLGYILHIIEACLLSSASEGKSLLTFIPLLNAGVMDLAILGFIIYFVKVKYSQGLAAIGLKIKGAGRFIFLAGLGYIAFLPILAFLLLLLIMLAALFNYHPPQQAIFRLFLQEKSLWLLVYSTMMVVVLGPVVEEIFFRGFTYNAIKKRWGVPPAMALTAVVFAGLHANLIGFLPIAALGFLLAYVYEKTGSLIPSITIHILHNGLMVALLFLGRYFMRFAQ
ncbi:MAG: CPBP family intramembrane metalloprotease [Candidatus Omnitrophica bacterium]|nr:CPBP family intramembrane metalloprotease [Candidatus Omnitrophota bacterium]